MRIEKTILIELKWNSPDSKGDNFIGKIVGDLNVHVGSNSNMSFENVYGVWVWG